MAISPEIIIVASRELEVYKCNCDHCGKVFFGCCAFIAFFDSIDELIKSIHYNDWAIKDEKHYCEKCKNEILCHIE